MRITPKRWSVETIMCGMRGHVAPAAAVGEVRPTDPPLAISQPGDSRLCRCLRCDAWIDYQEPTNEQIVSEHIVDMDDQPKPLRGRALNERITIRGIALLAWVNAVFFGIVSLLLLIILLGLPAIQHFAITQLQHLQNIVAQYRPTDTLIPNWEHRFNSLERWEIGVLLALAAGYAALQVIEALYLWRGRRWAEYLTAIESALFLPYLGYNAFFVPSPIHAASLLIQLAIIVYLVFAKRLFGVRGGSKKLQKLFAQEMNWQRIYRYPPLRPPPTEQQIERSVKP